MSLQDTQAAISAAVTPVVMISANAILISAISSKHQSMSDRLRALTAEWRNAATPVTPVTRREAIAGQLRLFDEQLRWVTLVAHRSLYGDSLLHRYGHRDRRVAGARSDVRRLAGVADRGRRTDVFGDSAGTARSGKSPRHCRAGGQRAAERPAALSSGT
jgi:hypothetical protein